METKPVTTAVILAAGLGTRLRPHTLTTPKPLLAVAGRPILEWNIEKLPAEISRVILVVGYLKERIMAHFGSSWNGREIAYVEQTELNGTGGAVAACADRLDGKFVVMNGDDLYAAADIGAALAHDLCIVTKEAVSGGRFGAFKTDAAGNMTEIIEGAEVGPGSLVNIGLYVLDRRFFDYPLVAINDKEFGLPQTLVAMAKDHPIRILKASFWQPIGYPEDLEKAAKILLAAS